MNDFNPYNYGSPAPSEHARQQVERMHHMQDMAVWSAPQYQQEPYTPNYSQSEPQHTGVDLGMVAIWAGLAYANRGTIARWMGHGQQRSAPTGSSPQTVQRTVSTGQVSIWLVVILVTLFALGII